VPPLDAEHSRWFAEEVQPLEPALRAYLRGSFPTLQDVDDLVQDAYARLLQARRAGRVTHTKAYLFATARNAALDLFRRGQVIAFEPIAEAHVSSVLEDKPHAADALTRDQEIDLLRDAVRSLPPRCGEILTMRKLQGMSYREIATALGISEHTVNAQLAIAVIRCRRYLQARGVGKGSA
jgi:RNA polymerase sigma-70 factor (ECF subfamily)